MTRFLMLAVAAAVFASGCAASPPAPPAPTPVVAEPPPPAPPAPAPPTAFSDRELADELVRQGVGVSKDGPTTPGGDLPTEIRQTPRGVVVTFRNVLFAFDSADLTAAARREIERMAFVLNHPQASTRRVSVEGHTDSIGTEAYNLELSRRRADAVAQELAARGVRRDRLTVEGFGKQRPVAPNTHADGKDNPAGRAVNRRVEAVVQPQDPAPR